MNEQRIHITNNEDRDVVATVLLNNDYKVWYEAIGGYDSESIEVLCYESIGKGE